MSRKQSCNKQSLTISAANAIINTQKNTKLPFFVILYPSLNLCTNKSRKASCMEYLALWEKYSVPLPTKPGISLIILKPMKILQRYSYRSTFFVWEMWRHHNMYWKWPPFVSRQDYTRRAIFWKFFASTSFVTAWISSGIFAFKASVVCSLFW